MTAARSLAVAAPLLAGAVLASPAAASTVSVALADSCNGDAACEKYAAGHPVPVTVFAGLPGEANRLTLSRVGETFVFRDAGAALAAVAPCTAVDANTARCPATAGEGGIPGLGLSLGDGDDEAVLMGDLGTEA